MPNLYPSPIYGDRLPSDLSTAQLVRIIQSCMLAVVHADRNNAIDCQQSYDMIVETLSDYDLLEV